MRTRLLAGFIGLALVLPVLWVGGVWVTLLVAFVVAVAMDEWAIMTHGPESRGRGRAFLIPAGLALHLGVQLAEAPLVLPLVACAVMAGLLVPMFAQADVERAGNEAMRNVAGLMYAPLMLAPLVDLRARPDGLWMIVYLLAAT